MTDGVRIHEHLDCAQEELWRAITDGEQLTSWFGGQCSIEPRIDGVVRFDLPDDHIVATGVVRACKPPAPGMTVAHLEHTFVDAARPELAAICSWSVVRAEDGCDLHFSMDGVGEAGAGHFGPVWARLDAGDALADETTEEDAIAALRGAPTVLLVDWVLPEIPGVIAATCATVYGKIGPAADDWATVTPDGDGFKATRCARPDSVDLLHLDWTLGFDEFVGVAAELGAKTFWYHSARTRPPHPADNRGCWVPSLQSARQRAAVEAAGMQYIDDHYIVDIARRVSS